MAGKQKSPTGADIMFVDGSSGVVCGQLRGAASRRRDAPEWQSIKPSPPSSGSQSIPAAPYVGTRTEHVIMLNSLIITSASSALMNVSRFYMPKTGGRGLNRTHRQLEQLVEMSNTTYKV